MNCAQDHLGPFGPPGQNSSFSFVVMPRRQVQACLRQSCFQLDNEHTKVPDGLRDAGSFGVLGSSFPFSFSFGLWAQFGLPSVGLQFPNVFVQENWWYKTQGL